MPVGVQLSVPQRDFIARDVILLPEDTMATVLGKLRGLMEGAGLEVEGFPACEEFELSIIRQACAFIRTCTVFTF